MNKIEINNEISQNFLDYAHEVNYQRAFADARDGLKPGQRACLWEMYVKGYSSKKPHVKSAKISGGVIADFWPHGDVAIYETFARMSQGWINNIPEIDWHGANGSVQISGDPASARYTEARLAKSSEDGLLFNIKKHNVKMKPNFSEDNEWPEVLPAIYPRLYVNGCQGIGSTIANVFLPHALDDLYAIIINYLKTKELDYSNLAPSFPTGGIIINKNDIPNIYKTGKGKVILRGKTEIKGNNILITEIPYQVYVEPLIEQIKNLVIKEEINGISNIYNKSDKKKLLIEIECDGIPATILNQLFAKTDLQKTYNANQFALVNKVPKLLTLKEYLDIYLQHNYNCIKSESEYDLKKSQERLEIVDGLIKALEDIDNIIALIKQSKSSSDAVINLIQKYKFTEVQANAIVNMKLGRLAHLEKVELNEEKVSLNSTITNCLEIINNPQKQQEIYLNRFTKFVKTYPNPRKTEVIQLDVKPKVVDKEVATVEPEKCVVIMTENGFIKRIPTASFKVQKRNGKGVKTQDDITNSIIRTNTVDTLMIFTNQGRMYRLLVDKIPVGTNTSKGITAASLVNMLPNEKPVVIYSIYKDTNAKFIFFCTKKGLVKKVPLTEYQTTGRKSGSIQATKIKEDDELCYVSLINDESVALFTKTGMGLRFKTTDLPISSRIAIGVKGITLTTDDEVIQATVVRENDNIALFTRSGMCKQISQNELMVQNRGGKGLMCYKNNLITGAISLAQDDSVLVVGDKKSICLAAKDITIASRASAGVPAISASNITSVSKI